MESIDHEEVQYNCRCAVPPCQGDDDIVGMSGACTIVNWGIALTNLQSSYLCGGPRPLSPPSLFVLG
jgi:hypothetical protein